MLLSLFLFGTIWFWLLLGAAALFIGICVSRDSFGKATLCLFGFFGALTLFGDFNVLHWLAHNGTSFLIGLGFYLAVGVFWSFAKWFFFVRRLRDEYLERRRAFLDRNDVRGDVIPDQLKKRWAAEIEQSWSRRGQTTYPPRARTYKGKITAWMAYWPWSLVVTMIDDPLRKLFNALFRMVQGAFQGVSDNAFRGLKDDFNIPTDASKPGNGTPPSADPERRDASRPQDNF